MPAKRCQVEGKSLSGKKKKLLERRLIQISLKLDGFVYKNKPITIYEAEMYIQEINSYQKDCAGDPRSLQVIEKLIRCMTSIINEHKETYGNPYTNTTLNDHDYCQSPVYSLPDEDRTQIIENIRQASRNLRDIETVNVCEEDDDSNGDINAAVSNLSIGDNKLSHNDNTQSDCSQSILGNIDINTFAEHTYVSTDKNKHSVNKSRTQVLPLNVNSSLSNIDALNTKEVTNSKHNAKELTKKVTRNNEVTKKEKPARKVRRNSTKRTCAIDNCSKTTDNNNKRKKTVKKLKDKTEDNAQNTKTGALNVRNKRLGNKSVANKNPVLKIYKNCTENDLSWLENIRYVREVSVEEYDTTFKAGDDFWDNLDIPGIWNDNDFAYN